MLVATSPSPSVTVSVRVIVMRLSVVKVALSLFEVVSVCLIARSWSSSTPVAVMVTVNTKSPLVAVLPSTTPPTVLESTTD